MARGALAGGRHRSSRISSGGELARLRARSAERCTCRAPTASSCRGSRSARSSRRCSSCCSAWACCPRRTPRCCEAQEQLAASARPVPSRRSKVRATRRASWRARSAARSRSSTAPAGSAAVAAMRWKQSVNENAKAPAFWNEYPELDHNEMCGWGQHGDVTRQMFTLVELRHGLEHPRLEPRVVATRELIEEALVPGADGRGGGRGPARAAARPHATSATGRATTSRSTTTSTPAPSTPSCSSRPRSNARSRRSNKQTLVLLWVDVAPHRAWTHVGRASPARHVAPHEVACRAARGGGPALPRSEVRWCTTVTGGPGRSGRHARSAPDVSSRTRPAAASVDAGTPPRYSAPSSGADSARSAARSVRVHVAPSGPPSTTSRSCSRGGSRR